MYLFVGKFRFVDRFLGLQSFNQKYVVGIPERLRGLYFNACNVDIVGRTDCSWTRRNSSRQPFTTKHRSSRLLDGIVRELYFKCDVVIRKPSWLKNCKINSAPNEAFSPLC